MSVGDWDVYASCECGWRERAPFGSKFHIHKEVCPCCGRPKAEWTLSTGRYGDNGFEVLPSPPPSPQQGGCAIHTTTAALLAVLIGTGVWFT